jgi:hypothetical protein
MRVHAFLLYSHACGTILGDGYPEHPVDRDPEATLRILGIKILVDRGSCGLPRRRRTIPCALRRNLYHPYQ